jgi:uncharacterized protein (DUF736 family)
MAKENTGTLSKNKYKKEDKHPDIKGKINVAGKEYELAGWQKTNENGSYYSLKISEPRIKEDFKPKDTDLNEDF